MRALNGPRLISVHGSNVSLIFRMLIIHYVFPFAMGIDVAPCLMVTI